MKKLPILLGGLLALLIVAGAVGATVVYADDSTPPTPSGWPGDGRGPRGFGLGPDELAAAAEALGMTTDELSAALQEGQTLEELAEAAGVDLQTVQDAIRAARIESMRARIEQGVTDGTISQEKADWLLEGLEKGFLDGPGFGFGHGGPGGPGQPPAQSANQ
jgi:transcriptional regulator with XRE-family HTH domain